MSNILKVLIPFLVIILFGTLGYYHIEKWSYIDSLYMTIISLTTVGYGETHPLSDRGKIFTMFLIFTGIGNFAYLIRNISLEFLNPFFGNVLKANKMKIKLKNIKNHYIICGYGRIGRDVAYNLKEANKSIVVVDSKELPESEILEKGFPMVIGDASHEDILIEAGIKTAKGLISTVGSEAGNVFITMTARELNRDLLIISRYEEEATKSKLIRAGADKYINPYHIGSEKISQIILKPTVSKILDFARQKGEFDLSIEELELLPNNHLINKTVKDCKIRDEYNIIIIAIEKPEGRIITNPGPNYIFQEKDRIVMIANQSEIVSIFQKYK